MSVLPIAARTTSIRSRLMIVWLTPSHTTIDGVAKATMVDKAIPTITIRMTSGKVLLRRSADLDRDLLGTIYVVVASLCWLN